MTLQKFRAELKALGSPEGAKTAQWFFKTGPGQYAEGDKFLGVTVPMVRRSVRLWGPKTTEADWRELLASPWHEVRLAGLLILVDNFTKTKDHAGRKRLVEFYLANIASINNWDLVDLSAPKIIGEYLFFAPQNERAILSKLSTSSNLWSRRIAILAFDTALLC